MTRNAFPVVARQTQVSLTRSDEGLSVLHSSADALHGRFRRELLACGVTRELTDAELRILDVLCSLIQADNVTVRGEPFVWLSQPRIRALAGLGRAAVQRRIDSLAARGVLTIHSEGFGRDAAVYVLHFATERIGRSPAPASGGAFEATLDQLRGRAAEPFEPRNPGLFDPDNLTRGIPTEASEARAGSARGIPAEASEARAASARGIPAEASEARAGSARGIPAEASRPVSGPENRDPRNKDSEGVVVVVSKTTTTTGPDPRAELLAREHFDPDVLAAVLAHPNCTLEQVRIAQALADRRSGFRDSRQAFVRAAIQKRWRPGRSAQQRRDEARPEHVQESAARDRLERAALAHREASALSVLARLDDRQLEAIGRQWVDQAPEGLSRESRRKMIAEQGGRPPAASFLALVFERFCCGDGGGGAK